MHEQASGDLTALPPYGSGGDGVTSGEHPSPLPPIKKQKASPPTPRSSTSPSG